MDPELFEEALLTSLQNRYKEIETWRNYQIFQVGAGYYLVGKIGEEKINEKTCESIYEARLHINDLLRKNPLISIYRGYGIYDKFQINLMIKKEGVSSYSEGADTVEATKKKIDKLLAPTMLKRIFSTLFK